MYTVYGIYDAGSAVALYIGSTHTDLHLRFTSHVTGCKIENRKYGTNPITIERMRVMHEHRDGKRVLEIRAIALCETRKEMLDREYEEIALHNPPLNISKGNTRKARGQYRHATQIAA